MPGVNPQASAPFPRGKTYFDGNTVDATSGEHLLGQRFVFDDRDPSDPMKARSGSWVVCELVRNVGAAAIGPKMAVIWKAGKRHKEIDGRVAVKHAEVAGIVDEFLPSGGLAVNDIGYIVVDGFSQCLTDLAGDEFTAFSEGDILHAATAATSGATTAGRVRQHDLTVAATGITMAEMIYNRIGRACSANTTAQTNRSVLVDVKIL